MKKYFTKLKLAHMIYDQIDKIKESPEYLIKKAKRKKKVFYVLAPTHANLGDHAITVATEVLLNDLKIDYFEVSDCFLYTLKKNNKLRLLNGLPIIINGGGNMGTLWFNVEKITRAVINVNPKSDIVILPNTFYYEDSEWGRDELKNSIDIYNSHKKLKIFAREKISYNAMKDIYRNVEMVPDMVLSMNKSENQVKRNGCLIVLRADKEGTIKEESKQYIIDQMKSVFDSVKITDMYAEGVSVVKKKDRAEKLEVKLKEFQSSEIVVTDRLHGMIFAAITGTPCIVVNSLSPKVKGCYEWIKDLEYIRFCDDLPKLKEVYYSMPKGTFHYDNSRLIPYYDKLKKELKEVCQK